MDMTLSLLDLAQECSARTAGFMLGGIVHNLNNPTHALAMQSELLANASRKGGIEPEKLLAKCERLKHVGEDLKSQLDILAWRNAYASPVAELLDPIHFTGWFLQFWRNNLFFKHSITVDLETDPPPPHVKIIPVALLWLLEEPLQAMTKAFSAQQPTPELGMRFETKGLDQDGVKFSILVTPATQNGSFSKIVVEHEESIRKLALGLGWEWQCSGDGSMFSVQARLSGKGTQ